jgi:drug/metabolite transporter (DMT)-like permease|tara:strand:+ start:633 stop:1496 length:864 start_codon:yes stop_codon:yes gene_type:complete
MFIFGVIFALVAGILFGLIGPTTKIAYNSGASVALTIFLRYAVASIIILPFIPYQKNLFEIFTKNLKYFLSISAGSILLTLGLLTSVIFIEVSLTILIFCLYPIYVLLFSIIIDKEKISLTVKLLFFVTFLGIVLVIGPSFKVINIIGILLAFLASLGSTSMIIINQKMSLKGISPIPINIFINIFNTIFFFVILKIFFSLNFNFDISIYLLILIPSVCYSFALLSQLIAIPKIGQSYTALFLYLEPVIGVLGAVFLLKENLGTYQMIGASIVIISLLSASFISSRN